MILKCTTMILSFRTDRPGQTVQTHIRLGGYTVCNALCIFWMHYSKEKPSFSTFLVITANFRMSEFLEISRYKTHYSCSNGDLWQVTQVGFFKKPRLGGYPTSHEEDQKKRNWCVRPGVSCPVPVFSRHDRRANSTLSAVQLEVQKIPFP